MTDEILQRLSYAYLPLMFGVLALAMLAEGMRARRALQHSIRRRWFANAALLVIDQVAVRFALPITLVGAALLAQGRGWGLFDLVEVPVAISVATAMLAMDAVTYAVHRLEHRVPLLWRMHRLHHSDPDVDVTTQFRFHPLEALLQGGASLIVVLALGTPPLAPLAYALVHAIIGPLSHVNVALPIQLDRALRWLVVTPDMHRTHHSTNAADYDTNYSVCFSMWDRLLGTYRESPAAGHAAVEFGLESRTPKQALSLPRQLLDPFLAERPAGLISALRTPVPDPAVGPSSAARESRA